MSCENDEPDSSVFLCNSKNPLSSLNVDNLDIDPILTMFPSVITPNGDGINDVFIIPYLNLHSNYTITILDLNNKVVFESKNNESLFDGKDQISGKDLKYGSYQYKLVIENEQTFLQYGYLSIIRNKSEAHGFDFTNCFSVHTQDPILD